MNSERKFVGRAELITSATRIRLADRAVNGHCFTHVFDQFNSLCATFVVIHEANFTTPGAPMKRYLSLLLCVGITLGTVGCATWERTTFQSLTASQAVLNKAQDDYEARLIPKTACVQDLITTGKNADVAGVEAFKLYAVLKLAGQDVTAQIENINTDVASVLSIVAKIQSLNTVPCVSGGSK